jgi:DNA-binding GntR family transcriptional regulator
MLEEIVTRRGSLVDKAVRENRAANGGAGRLTAQQEPQVSLRSRIIESLRRAIETGVLEPGARLVERELCEQLKVSRTSLREALGELQAEGILTYSPTRRLSVSVISPADAENAYRIRGTLEALVVEQFIEKASEDECAALIKEGDRLKAAYRSGDVDRMLVAKRAFYDRICSGAQNAIAFDIINRLVLRTSGLRRHSLLRVERQQQSINEVDTLLNAVTRRDIATARQAALQNVANSAKSALIDFVA